MSRTLLIDSIVRQTTVLIASLATASGNRPSLAHLANQVLGNLVGELKAQGLGNKVIADMLGMALRTYHDRVARLAVQIIPAMAVQERTCSNARLEKNVGGTPVPLVDDRPPSSNSPGYFLDGRYFEPSFNEGCERDS